MAYTSKQRCLAFLSADNDVHVARFTDANCLKHSRQLNQTDVPLSAPDSPLRKTPHTLDAVLQCQPRLVWTHDAVVVTAVVPSSPHRVLNWSASGVALQGLYLAQEPMLEGGVVQGVLWTEQSNHLLALVHQHGHTLLVEADFLRSAAIESPALLRSTEAVLIGPNCIKMSSSAMQGQQDTALHLQQVDDLERLCSMNWINIPVPQAYYNRNAPIRYIAVTDDGSYLIMAGRTGFAVHSIASVKWRMIGNQTMEESVECTAAPVCYQHVALVPLHSLFPSVSNEDKSYSIRAFDLSQRLDINNPIAQVKLAHQPLCLTVDDDHLAVYTRNHYLHVLTIQREDQGGLRLRQRARINLVAAPTSLYFPPQEIQSLSISNYSHIDHTLKHYPATCVFLHSGHVTCLSLEPVDYTSEQLQAADPAFLLAQDVDRVWLPSKPVSAVLSSSMWFACGRQGVKVWMPVASEQEGHRRLMLPLPIQLDPLSLIFNRGIAVAVSCELLRLTDDQEQLHCYWSVQRQTQLFMQYFLTALLKRGFVTTASQVASSLQPLGYFGHILELLLHGVVDDPVEDVTELLPRIVSFVKQYNNWKTVVVQCARKTEMSTWDKLFEHAGTPTEIFQACMQDDDLVTASSYLMVMQAKLSVEQTRHHTFDLLAAALSKDEWDLARDLIRFLDVTNEDQHRDRVQAIHDAVLAQVGYLLQQGQLIKAARLCSHLDQDIETIIRRLPAKDLRVKDLGAAMAQLLTDLPAISVASSAQSWQKSQIETEYLQQQGQLIYLKRCTQAASDWQLVIGLMLTDVAPGSALPGVTVAHIQRARQAFSVSTKLTQSRKQYLHERLDVLAANLHERGAAVVDPDDFERERTPAPTPTPAQMNGTKSRPTGNDDGCRLQ
eukprot:TRINITY_DN11627_c0_g1_i1.p1 TRINITY_DN11627_c0_g1~~TRINITY_DN11627_c0_g1_i1.p1  ORF type:complete len:960 (+),score=210.53 TRINITY_DN11627_c0_g1_i1:215-2881(+)